MLGFLGETHAWTPKPALIFNEFGLKEDHLPFISVENSRDKHLRRFEILYYWICAIQSGEFDLFLGVFSLHISLDVSLVQWSSYFLVGCCYSSRKTETKPSYSFNFGENLSSLSCHADWLTIIFANQDVFFFLM